MAAVRTRSSSASVLSRRAKNLYFSDFSDHRRIWMSRALASGFAISAIPSEIRLYPSALPQAILESLLTVSYRASSHSRIRLVIYRIKKARTLWFLSRLACNTLFVLRRHLPKRSARFGPTFLGNSDTCTPTLTIVPERNRLRSQCQASSKDKSRLGQNQLTET